MTRVKLIKGTKNNNSHCQLIIASVKIFVMPNLKVKTKPSNLGWHFKITLESDQGFFEYEVTMDRDFYSRLSTSAHPEKVIEKCFECLIETKSATEIMKEFDVGTVERYFPGLMAKVQEKLEQDKETF